VSGGLTYRTSNSSLVPRFNCAARLPADRNDLFAPWENSFPSDGPEYGAPGDYAVPLTAQFEQPRSHQDAQQRVEKGRDKLTQQAVNSASFFAGDDDGPRKARWEGCASFMGAKCSLHGDPGIEPAQPMPIDSIELLPSTRFPWPRLSQIWCRWLKTFLIYPGPMHIFVAWNDTYRDMLYGGETKVKGKHRWTIPQEILSVNPSMSHLHLFVAPPANDQLSGPTCRHTLQI
jgi:hypothetical protein